MKSFEFISFIIKGRDNKKVMITTNVFIPYALTPYYGAMPGFAKLPQKKNAAILKKRLQRSLNLIQF